MLIAKHFGYICPQGLLWRENYLKTIMKKTYLIIVFAFYALLFTFNVFGQSITWQRTYFQTSDDRANSIIQLADEGYIVSGDTDPLIGYNTMRLNKFGDTIWTKSLINAGIKIIRSSDNNYIILGHGNRLTKIDILGNILWTVVTYGTNASLIDFIELSNSDLIICGLKDNGVIGKPFLIRTNSTGGFLWEKTFTTNIFDGMFSNVSVAGVNELIFTGEYSNTDTITAKLFIAKTDFFGNQIFFYGYDSLRYHYPQFIYSINVDSYVIGGANGTFLTKISSNGIIQWYRKFLIGEANDCRGGINTNDGGYILTGFWKLTGNNFNSAYLIKVDTLGVEQWRKTYGTNDDYCSNDIKQTSDSGYVICGFGGDDYFVAKTDRTGLIGIKPISN